MSFNIVFSVAKNYINLSETPDTAEPHVIIFPADEENMGIKFPPTFI